ncbi:Tol-Pal system beta propeller repeat protein TolB [Plasticicumulans sp.]|uniref:Tol-Pal system beta propeller repeat protein TolB n=1 Tax=Plasticicumulans sp. TaxID=2307179 RepID=UPI0039289C9D
MLKTLPTRARAFAALLLTLAAVTTARAELTIEIVKGVEGALPIAIAPFGGNAGLPADISAIITADLKRSGRFSPLASSQYADRPTELSQVNYASFRSIGVPHLAVGQVRAGGAGYAVQFQLADVYQGSQLLGSSFDVRSGDLRRVAHHIADLIYEKLTGEKGAFNTRIAYVTARGTSSYTLVVADSDGYNPQVVLRSPLPVMSPAWSPDGSKLAYVSFENRAAQIVVQNVFTGARQTISASPGINGAPAWSPDGSQLAFTLSKDGNPEIYRYDLASRQTQRLTSTSAIDTEATWSPDGGSIVFTSDRGGGPQLYRMPASGGGAERLTFSGDYNSRPTFSPDGKSIAYVTRSGGRFHIAVMDASGRNTRLLTDGGMDESPSFAPNGGMILYATQQGGRGVLAAVSTDGRVRQTLLSTDGEVREPAWSPYGR